MMIYSPHEKAVVFHSNVVMEVPIRGVALGRTGTPLTELK